MSHDDPGDFRAKYGPWAVIAGGSDGTGADFARRIAGHGVNCLLAARRVEPLETLAAELRARHGVQTRVLSVDLSSTDAAERLSQAAADLEVGLYVSNAGADTNASQFLDAPLGAWRKLLQINVETAVDACHHFAAPMRLRGRGGLILMASVVGLGGAPAMAVYSASKAFTLAFAESLWAELGPHGVDVLGVAAPFMDTPTIRRAFSGMGDELQQRSTRSETVVDAALARLVDGPLYIYPSGPDGDQAEQLEAKRRQRVMAMAQSTKTIVAGAS